MSGLKLEEGKRYWRRDGGVSGPLIVGSTEWFTDGFGHWRSNGLYTASGETRYDLVGEYVEPEPLKWKRGIPTEEECRECWIVWGFQGDVPVYSGHFYHPGEITNRGKWDNRDWYLALRIQPVEPPKPKTITQRQYVKDTREELWTHEEMGVCWNPTGLTREVPA